MALAGASLITALLLTTLAVKAAAKQKIASDLERTLESFQQLAKASQDRIRDVAEARTLDRSFKEMSLSVNSSDAEAGLGDASSETRGILSAREVIASADTEAF